MAEGALVEVWVVTLGKWPEDAEVAGVFASREAAEAAYPASKWPYIDGPFVLQGLEATPE